MNVTWSIHLPEPLKIFIVCEETNKDIYVKAQYIHQWWKKKSYAIMLCTFETVGHAQSKNYDLEMKNI